VCEQHGRIAYRRADGSRLITSNDHWKSQVRHALYTGGRFERVPSNGEYWQLAPAFKGTPAELVKVLVRADDRTQHIRATLALVPSTGRTILPKLTVETAPGGGTARQRRKRAATGEASAEAMCDSVDPAVPATMRAPPARQRARTGGDSSAPDNHSTHDEGQEAPARRVPRRAVRRPVWKVEDGEDELMYDGEEEEEQQQPAQAPQQRVKREQQQLYASKDSADPSTLRWGSTALRSTIIISAADSSGLSAGRTPLLPRAGGRAKLDRRRRDASAEADSVPKGPGTALPKRAALPTPATAADGPAQLSPPALMAQWAEAMQQQMEEQQKAMSSAAAFAPPGFPPMAMMLPGLLAAAAPFFAGGPQMAAAAAQQHQHHQQQQQAALHQQMQAALMLAAAAAGGGQDMAEGGGGGGDHNYRQ
jgi:hypothetical protein